MRRVDRREERALGDPEHRRRLERDRGRGEALAFERGHGADGLAGAEEAGFEESGGLRKAAHARSGGGGKRRGGADPSVHQSTRRVPNMRPARIAKRTPAPRRSAQSSSLRRT